MSTTTTSKRLLIRRCKYLRWRRKYLLLQVDQKRKQNQEDLPLLVHLPELHLFVKEPRAQSDQAYPVAKRLNTLLRHGQLPREEDGAIEFWKLRRWSSEQIWALSTLVWWNVEEQNGRRRKQQEKISILYWPVRTRNSLSLSSSRSFRTQSHWSCTSGQCVTSKQFLRVHLSCWMCNQFTFHHKFRIDSGRTKFEQQTDSILAASGSHAQES